jgi:hypothetical protein
VRSGGQLRRRQPENVEQFGGQVRSITGFMEGKERSAFERQFDGPCVEDRASFRRYVVDPGL